MQSSALEDTFRVKKGDSDETGAAGLCGLNDSVDTPTVLSPNEGNMPRGTVDEDSHSHEDVSKQLVLYDPKANGSCDIEPVSDPSQHQTPPSTGYSSKNLTRRVLPSVGAFTVQCANCFKWRLIPTKEKYEEIREHILERPFVCESAREWRPEMSCDDPADIQQDGSRLWAIDKPNIAQPPPGWERELRIRGEGSSRFADVYYIAPSGKRLRSTVEVQKYLLKHPEYISERVTISQFSFQIPKPIQENYVRKHHARLTASGDDASLAMSRPLDLAEVDPLSWASPDNTNVLRLGGPGLPASDSNEPPFNSNGRPVKKARKASASLKRMHNVDNFKYHHRMTLGDRRASTNSAL